MRCVFCRSTNNIRRAPAYAKGGRLIKDSRVFTIHTCEQDAEVAEISFDNPFTDDQMIKLYRESIRGE